MAAYSQQIGQICLAPIIVRVSPIMDNYYYSMPKNRYTAKYPQQANNSYSHGYREQNSYYNEPHNATVQFSGSPVGITEYLCLTNEDLMYEGNLHRLKNPDFQVILRKITKDLNFLLHFQYEDFWEELEKSQSLKKCLRSCLQILPRKHFGSYIKHKTPTQNPPTQILQDETYKILGQLMRIVLFLYHRIICEAQQAQLDIVYDEWLLDIPKMFNLIGIYKHSNLKIVNEIIDTAFRVIPHYRDDIVEFIKIMNTVLLNALQLDLSYEYTQKLIKNSKNFNNPMQSFTRNLIKSFVRVFDMFVTLLDFVNLFPVRYVMMLIAEPDFVMELVDRYFQYLTNVEGRWEFTPQFLDRFEPVIHVTRQKMVEFFLRVFDFLDQILAQRIAEEAWNRCLRLYFIMCKEFHRRNESPSGERWETFINVIIAETPHRKVFRLEPFFSHKLDPREMSIIQSCQDYEKEFRKELNRKHFHVEQILELKLMAIKSYKEWNDFENFKEFDLIVEDSYRDATIKEDSILNFLDSEFQKAEFKKRKPHSDPNNLYDLKYKKVNKYPFFADEEYNDEPPFVENEGLEQGYEYPFGMEPLEDLEGAQQLKSNPSQPSTEIETKTPSRFLKSKHQYENYEKYYNAVPAGPNNNFNSNFSQAGQKTKRKYICADELSIEYESQQVSSNIKVEKMEPKVSGTIFKRVDEGKDKDKREQKSKEEELNNLTISIQQEKDQHIENTNELANLMDEIAREELSIIEQSTDGQRKKVTKYFDADDSKLSKLGSSISGMDSSVDDIEIKEYFKLKDSANSQNQSNLSISYHEEPSKNVSNATGKSTQSKGKKSKKKEDKAKKETKKLVYGQLW